jgi:hypothetical protein
VTEPSIEAILIRLDAQDKAIDTVLRKLDNISLVAKVMRWVIGTAIAIYAAAGGSHGFPWNTK